MGSFIGHIDEGLFFIFLSIWWMYKVYLDYIKAGFDSNKVTTPMSYESVVCKRRLPLEIVSKILFPVGGFLGEFFVEGVNLLDEEGNFRKMGEIQHMTIYSIFILHGIIDLLTWFRVPIVKDTNALSAVIAFIWYGVAFYWHSMDGRDHLEAIVHKLPIMIMFGAAIAILVELWQEHKGIWPILARSYFVLTLGTWFSHIAFVLYTYEELPNGERKLYWDREDHRNVHFMVAAMGIHLIVNMIFVTGFFWLVCAVYKVLERFGSLSEVAPAWNKHNEGIIANGTYKVEQYRLLSPADDEEI